MTPLTVEELKDYVNELKFEKKFISSQLALLKAGLIEFGRGDDGKIVVSITEKGKRHG